MGKRAAQRNLFVVQGAQGATGSQGIKGDQGFTGAKGDQGAQGAQGSQGFQGDVGPQGLKGDQGFQGFQGIKGDQGFQGITGDQGAQGAQGSQGEVGSQGIQGAQGSQGFQGAQGAGEQGAQGDQGVAGQDASIDNMSTASFYDNTAGQTIATSETVVNLNTTRLNNAVSMFSLASNQVTVSDSGFYLVSWNVGWKLGSGTRSGLRSYIQVDTGSGFSTIDASVAFSYGRLTGQYMGSSGGSIVLDLNAGYMIRLASMGESENGVTAPNSVFLNIVHLKGAKGVQGAQGADGTATINNDSVSYAKIAYDLKGINAVSASNIDWDAGGIHTKTITGSTTFTFSHLRKNKVITILLTGNYTVTWPSYMDADHLISGEYDGTRMNYIQVHCTNDASSSEEVWWAIKTEGV